MINNYVGKRIPLLHNAGYWLVVELQEMTPEGMKAKVLRSRITEAEAKRLASVNPLPSSVGDKLFPGRHAALTHLPEERIRA